jgi:hypothetical protein
VNQGTTSVESRGRSARWRRRPPGWRIEQGVVAHRLDVAFYAIVPLALGLATVWWSSSRGSLGVLLAWALAGAGAWLPMEYLLHRFVLHRLQPFVAWHEEHHRRPWARIAAPTPVSATLFAGLVYAPAWVLFGAWPATAFMTGMLASYLLYSLTHHAIHQPTSPASASGFTGRWLAARRRWHARHHAAGLHRALPGRYGVTSGLCDHLFGSAAGPSVRAARCTTSLRRRPCRPSIPPNHPEGFP